MPGPGIGTCRTTCPVVDKGPEIEQGVQRTVSALAGIVTSGTSAS
ncbi:MAG: hypothetical protein ACLQDY_15935 [Streptosporangiaceae bacterium]